MADISTLRALLPQFAGVSDDTLQLYLDMAARGVDLTAFGESTDDAHVFLAAHLMSLAGIGPGAQAGSLAGFTNLRVGSLSLTRSERASAGDFAASQYGILFFKLRQRFASGGGVGFMVTGTGTLPVNDPRFYAPPHGEG